MVISDEQIKISGNLSTTSCLAWFGGQDLPILPKGPRPQRQPLFEQFSLGAPRVIKYKPSLRGLAKGDDLEQAALRLPNCLQQLDAHEAQEVDFEGEPSAYLAGLGFC
jgi:hypothetical protein